jgi:structural maintenance of chromosome 3 (chondroitin sulfate proteoglycan 6)
MDGDRIDRKGSLTGGYHDIRRSRIDAIKAVALWKGKLDTETARHVEVKASIMKLEQEISVNLGKIQVIESQRKAQLDDRLALTTRASWITKENEQARVRVERMERALAEAEREEQSIQTRIEALQAEMGSAFTQNLTAAEIRTLRDLNAQLTRQQEEYKKVAHARSQVRRDSRSILGSADLVLLYRLATRSVSSR